MDATAREEIKSKVLANLEQTLFAAASLHALSGGTANFLYHATLKKSLPDGTIDVLVKHSEDYIANSPTFKLTLFRCRIEEECLKALSDFSIEEKSSDTARFIVRTPRVYHFDEERSTQIQELLRDGKDLKTYALDTYLANTPDAVRPQCLQLGRALGKWLRSFHTWSATQTGLRQMVTGNKELQQLKHYINFSWLLDRVEQFPSILSEAKGVFENVKEMAAKELEDESQLQPIHGDFWTGNILLPDRPIHENSDITMFVIDWEMAQMGLPNLDFGQMVAELYELKLYKDITAGLWMVQGFAEGYGEVSDDFAFRTAIQIGAHLVSFGTSVQGWGTPEQVEMVARTGRDIIVHAWQKDRAWFQQGDLACLFGSAA
ncbi:kinase-like domain-containing protein [Xylaria bambusicola]|uniref:kinase-like domain-containing protein n=1 Tax=Xylaria bambusicola TaxID=326684 RepID=UPI002008239F|nr:kinase-like domain-containing protein [Xylaria bambusicola]KAI0526377.1 kinase-like domain-containing protein [Xylaria bambusicola]